MHPRLGAALSGVTERGDLARDGALLGAEGGVLVEERVPLSIILEMRRDQANSVALEQLTSELISALGKNNPPFQDAARADADPIERARGLLLFQELTFTCEQFLFRSNDDGLKALVKVTAEHFHEFLK